VVNAAALFVTVTTAPAFANQEANVYCDSARQRLQVPEELQGQRVAVSGQIEARRQGEHKYGNGEIIAGSDPLIRHRALKGA
jgi:hypothetical protein